MKQENITLTCSVGIAGENAFSIKGALLLCNDHIALPAAEVRPGWCFSFGSSLIARGWQLTARRFGELVFSITGQVFSETARVLRQAAAGVRRFSGSLCRQFRRLAPQVPVMLRL